MEYKASHQSSYHVSILRLIKTNLIIGEINCYLLPYNQRAAGRIIMEHNKLLIT